MQEAMEYIRIMGLSSAAAVQDQGQALYLGQAAACSATTTQQAARRQDIAPLLPTVWCSRGEVRAGSGSCGGVPGRDKIICR